MARDSLHVRSDVKSLLKILKIMVAVISLHIVFINHFISIDIHPRISSNDKRKTSVKSMKNSQLDRYMPLEKEFNRKDNNIKKSVSHQVDLDMTEKNNDGNESMDVLTMAINMLGRAGVYPDKDQKETLVSALKDSRFHEVYGDKPIILGKNQCEKFRNKYSAINRLVAPMGTFNSGTNLLFKSLFENCALKERQRKYGPSSGGMRKQVSWGKHSPSSYRGQSTSETGGDVPAEQFLPVIIVKDPFTWMQSFCRHWYNSYWTKISGHCPNLVPINAKEKVLNKFKPTFPVHIHYKHDIIQYDSLVDLWNRWYEDYIMQVDFPRMVIRFEDLLFHIEEVTTEVCDCVGGQMKKEFKYIIVPAKEAKYGHRGSSGMFQSLLKYGNLNTRFKDFTEFDKEYALKNLHPDLMKMFRYDKI